MFWRKEHRNMDGPVVQTVVLPQTPSQESASSESNSISLVLHNKELRPNDLNRYIEEKLDENANSTTTTNNNNNKNNNNNNSSYKLRGIDISYCWCDYRRKKSHERKLLAELLELLQQHAETLEFVKLLAGLFPRHEQDVRSILSALEMSRHLEVIQLQVPEDARVPFTEKWPALVRRNACLSMVRLEGFDLSDISSSIVYMVQAFKNAVGLRHLFLGGCRLTDKALWKLIQGLDYCKRLKRLQLPRASSLSVISLLTMAALLNANAELQWLDLTGNKGLFEDAIQENEQVKQEAQARQQTSLLDTTITTTTSATTATTESQREDALTVFMRSLRNNSTLMQLWLGHCNITDDIFQFLLCSLEHNRKLDTLLLNHNQITRRVGLQQHLCHALPRLKALKRLELQGLVQKSKKHNGNKATSRTPEEEGPDIITPTTTTTATMIYPQPDLHKWRSAELQDFCQALQENQTLCHLVLDEVRQHEAINDILERNQTLQRVKKFEKLAQGNNDTDQYNDDDDNKTAPYLNYSEQMRRI